MGTRGFSIVFRRSHLDQVEQNFPYFQPYLERALQADCNAFYLNPLLLQTGSRVDPHIDRSLRSYCKSIDPPQVVSVLYVTVPEDLAGGELILCAQKRRVAQIRPQVNTLVIFQGDLTHSITPVTQGQERLSLVCEQYCLEPDQLEQIPDYCLESRALSKPNGKSRNKRRRSKH